MIGFIEKYGTLILIILSAIVVAVVAFVIIAEVQTNNRDRALVLLEELEVATADDPLALSLDEFAERVALIRQRSRNDYVQNRVTFLFANAYWHHGQYELAAEEYQRLLKRSPETHFGQISFFNAAIAHEQNGNAAEAISILEQTLSVYEFSTNPLLPRVLLNLGRLYEAENDLERANAYYMRLIDDYSGHELVNLAYNRLIIIENSN